MACDLATTQLAACSSGIGKLDSQIRLLHVIAQSTTDTLAALNPAIDVSLDAIQLRACESGIGKLDNPIALLQIIAQNLCSQIE